MFCNFNRINLDCKKQQDKLTKVVYDGDTLWLCDVCKDSIIKTKILRNPRKSIKEHKQNIYTLLEQQDKPVTQHTIRDLTNLSMTIVSNAVNALVYEGSIKCQTFSDGQVTRPRKFYAIKLDTFKSFLRRSFKSQSMSFRETYLLTLIRSNKLVTIDILCKLLRADHYKVSKSLITSCILKLTRYGFLYSTKIKSGNIYLVYYSTDQNVLATLTDNHNLPLPTEGFRKVTK